MVGILRLVMIGLHRFAPPSDKAELDASIAVTRGAVSLGPTSDPRRSVHFRVPELKRILHTTLALQTKIKG